MSSITCIENDYMTFLSNSLNKTSYPFQNPGFNLSYTKLNKQYDIFIIRCVIPIKVLADGTKKLIPGFEKWILKYLISNVKDLDETNVKDLISNDFIWNWSNYYESNIIFVGNLERDGSIKVNNKIKPYVMIDPKYTIKLSNNLTNVGIKESDHQLTKTDFRLLNIHNKVFIMDTNVTEIQEIFLKNNKLMIGKIKYNDICFSLYNSKNANYDYYKTRNKKFGLPKNWSLFKTSNEGKKMNFYFFHDFTDNGISIIKYDKTNCKEIQIIKYKGDIIPNNDIYGVIRFSFGSTILKKKKYYYGIGHFKSFYKSKDLNSSNKHIHDKIISIKKVLLKGVKKNNVKLHPSKMYGYYYFRYNEDSGKFLLSDGFILFPRCTKYLIPLCFPMSMEERYDKVFISLGYGDYTNLIMKTSTKEIDKLLIHNAKRFDLKKYNIRISLI